MESRHVLSVLVENKSGVLSRVVGLISRRGFNIDSLSVAPTEDAARSRITIIVEADERAYEQVIKQLNKLVCVFKLHDLTEDSYLERELVLFKIDCPPERRAGLVEVINHFGARIADMGADSLTIEATGAAGALDDFESLLRPYGIREITRTGKVAISRDAK